MDYKAQNPSMVKDWTLDNESHESVNAPDRNGDTPLHIAVKALVDRVKLEAMKSEKGETKRDIVQKCQSQMDIVKDLCVMADLTAVNKDGHYPCYSFLRHMQLYWNIPEVLEVADVLITAKTSEQSWKRIDGYICHF